jgi:AcrR family transcriptional regulator
MPLAKSQLPLSPPSHSGDPSTKERILSAAEELFAAEGFEKVSLRAITQSADANLASVNYHFGSKDALIDAVIERIIAPVNQERLQRLDALETACEPGQTIPLPDILYAFLRPLVVAIKKSELSERMFFRLMGRCMSEPDYRIPESAIPQFQEVVDRFSATLTRTLPELPPDLILWRLYFTVGTLVQSLMHVDALNAISKGRSGNPPLDEILHRIIDYCVGGFTAPAIGKK